MFPACLPENRHTSSLLHIPFENLGVLEDEKTGWIGQEIYGCGQVFQAYLMWEALAKSSDRSVMVLNLNNYLALELSDLQRGDLIFIVFNPERDSRRTSIDIGETKVIRVSTGANLERLKLAAMKANAVEVTLEPGEVLYLRVER